MATGLLATVVWAQAPAPPPGPPGPPVGPWPPLTPAQAHRKHWADTFIGRPADFVEPPFGYYVHETFGMMKSKADSHRFTLYRSDFLEGTDKLSPIGAARFNVMAARLRGWLGPVVIEWSPDRPNLAEMRRTAVLAALQGAGFGIVPERVVIGPSPYPGGLGTDGANYHNTMIYRDQNAGQNYSLTPTSSSGFGGLGAGGSGGP
jgi:hypothetical protein